MPTASEDLNLPMEARSGLVTLPDGAFDQDGDALVLRPVLIERTFKITSGIDVNLDALMTAFRGGRNILKAVLRDNSTYRQTFAKVVRVERPRNAAAVNYQELRVTFEQDYPYWLATADEPSYLGQGGTLGSGTLDGQFKDITINALSVASTITNSGALPVMRGTIVIIPDSPNGRISDLQIANAANQMWLRYVSTVTYPQILVIDLLSKSIKIDGVNTYAYLRIPDTQMDWMRLETGDNTLTLTVNARTGTTHVHYHWARHYV